jgi:hypothetical protein
MSYGTTRGTGTGTFPTKYFFPWPQKCARRIRASQFHASQIWILNSDLRIRGSDSVRHKIEAGTPIRGFGLRPMASPEG